MLAARDWIILGHPQRRWMGVYGDPNVLLANKLSGWFHLGVVMGQWRLSWCLAGIFWEWLPALVFGLGLLLVLRRFPCPARLRLPRRFPWPAALAGGLLLGTAAIAWCCFGGIPHVQDSIAQQFQAEIFARGLLFAPVPAGSEFFSSEFLIQHQGKWFAQYPPMQAALLALGSLAGVPWLVNPVLGALSGLLIYGAARRVYGARVALAASLFYAASPFVWFMSAERMNHGATLFFIAAAFYLYAPALSDRSNLHPVRWLAGALALGLAASARPLDAAAVALPLLLGVLWPRPCAVDEDECSGWPWNVLPYAPLVGIGLLIGVAPLLVFNWATTGSPLVSGYELLWGNSGWGFGKAQWGPPHTPAIGLEHLLSNWDGAAKYLFEWPLPCLVPLAGLCCLPRWRRMDRVLVGTLASLTLAYLPYFYQDLCLGPRFLYAGMPAFAILSARGLFAAGAAWGAWKAGHPRRGVQLATQTTAFCAAAGLLFNLPVLFQWYGNSFWGTNRTLVDSARDMRLGKSIIFIRDYAHARVLDMVEMGVSRRVAQGAVERLDERWLDRMLDEAAAYPRSTRGAWLEASLDAAICSPRHHHKRVHPPWVDWQGYTASVYSGLWANTPWPDEQQVLFALDRGPRNRELLRHYPDRTPWRFDFDAQSWDFCLMPFRLDRELAGEVRLTRNGSSARKARTP